ncbi:MAG TPA: NADH:ubiquinone oxidoreductase subunit NDUFA12 [Alphaproteobacteria bacterium]|nr:NADH:ubiquinone oxidoreductase subunit NDUFA12 [Alphaproteobacteria bacterium]
MPTLGTRLYTWLCGELVGADSFANRYYRRRAANWRAERRWVIYRGRDEASKVPAEWHGWLHHTLERPPTDEPLPARPWEKEHVPNLTGSALAYRPPGHVLAGGKRDKATGDYEAWQPPS